MSKGIFCFCSTNHLRSPMITLVFSILFWGLGASAALVAELEETRNSHKDDGRRVLVHSVNIEVKGLSNKKILRNRIGVQPGDEFNNLSELRKVLDTGFNGLYGTGYFKRDGGIRYRLVDEGAAGKLRQFRLEAEFEDAWTIYPLAYPYYSTAVGFGIRGRLKWDNFLGLLGGVTLRADVTQVRDGEYGPDVSGGFGVSTIKLAPNFGINGGLKLTRDARVDGANWVLGINLGAGFTIDTLKAAGIGMGYNFDVGSSVTFGYTGKQTTQPSFSGGFSHSIGLSKERYSSGGVMSDGYSMSLSNSYSIDTDPGSMTGPRNLALEDIGFGYSLKLSRSYADIINFKGRVGIGKSFDFANGIYNANGYNLDASSYNRGKRSGAAKGNFIAYLNMDMAISVFRDTALGDVLLSPFLDMSWLNNEDGFQLENTVLGSGFELIWVFNSLKFRFSYGIDLHQPELYTIAITTGFFF